MTSARFEPAAATMLHADHAAEGPLTCPMCQTVAPTQTVDEGHADGDWRCDRCGQRWSPLRLATVSAYARWSLAHDTGVRGVLPSAPRIQP